MLNYVKSTKKGREVYELKDATYPTILPHNKENLEYVANLALTEPGVKFDVYGNDLIYLLRRKASEDLEPLPTGYYKVTVHWSGTSLTSHELETDELLFTTEQEKTLDLLRTEISALMDVKEFTKRSYLLCGEPGNGKTTIIRQLLKENNDAYVFEVTGSLDEETGLDFIGDLPEDKLKFVVFEEVLTHVQDSPTVLLKFLDGLTKLHRTVILMTTNYPENLPANYVDRPGRIDRVLLYPAPKPKDQVELLEHLLTRKLTAEEIKELPKDFSIAYLKELQIQEVVFNVPLLETLKQLKFRKTLINKGKFSSKVRSGIGFGNVEEEDGGFIA